MPRRSLPPVAPALCFALLTDARQLEALAPAWEDLLGRSSANEPMLSPAWLLPWWDVYAGSRQLRVGTFHEGDRLIGLALLQCRRHWYRVGVPYLELAPLGASTGQPDDVCSEYLNLLVERGREGDVTAAFVRALRTGQFGRWHEISLPMMDGEHPLRGMLGDAFTGAGFRVDEEVQTEAPYIPLPATWDAYAEALGKHRRLLVKSLRDFEAWAGGDVEIHRAESADEVAKGKQVLHQLHAERWQAAGQEGVFRANRFTRFHDRVMAALLERNALDLCWLSVRRQPVAAVYNIRWNGKVYFYQSGRALDVPGQVRPGIVLHAHRIRAAIEAGDREYDFLGGAVQYKRQLSPACRQIVRIRAGCAPVRERLRDAYLGGRRLGRRLYHLCRGNPRPAQSRQS